MDADQKTRMGWVQLYEKIGNAGIVCRRCGISRPTLRKWWRRYEDKGIDGLKSRSRRPHNSPNRKVRGTEEAVILSLRRERRLGVKQLRSVLIRDHDLRFSLDTIHRTLIRNGERHLTKRRRRKKAYRRYERPVPGDRVQLDVCKIAPANYQYTAVDDCSRFRVLGLYSRRTARNSIDFLERVIEEMPFPIQRIQTDRGREFFAYAFQEFLKSQAIKFRPIKPYSPHLNGKVERSQRTDLDEFWSGVDMNDPELHTRLEEWQMHYNWYRPHSALGGASPMDRVCDRLEKTPLSEEVFHTFDPSQERIREQNWVLDGTIASLK